MMKKLFLLGTILATSLTTARADWYGHVDFRDDRGGRGDYYERGRYDDDRYDGRGRGGYGYGDRGYSNYRRPMSVEARAQIQLRRLGYYYGPIDGDFGSGSRRALYRFQYDRRLPRSGWLDWPTLRALGLR